MADGEVHHTTALDEFVDALMNAGLNDEPVTIYTDGRWYGWSYPTEPQWREHIDAMVRGAYDAHMLSRCSPEHPCEYRNPAHMLLWGECWHTDPDEIPDPGVQAR